MKSVGIDVHIADLNHDLAAKKNMLPRASFWGKSLRLSPKNVEVMNSYNIT